ncbi:hypothetical protein [Methylocystis sp.]|uniref:hypothetical protein n=1 Tax=Methylocystis sp. TaxID=1911079 RepID=UPI0025DEEA9D|nr:hypothetical protein [Methylocystis sp.]
MTPADTADALFAKAAEFRARYEAALAEARRLQAQEREDAIVEALGLYSGSDRARATMLAAHLQAYAANGWLRECCLDELPDSKAPQRRALHRILRSRQGKPLGWRQIHNIGAVCNRERMTLHTPQCESHDEQFAEQRGADVSS